MHKHSARPFVNAGGSDLPANILGQESPKSLPHHTQRHILSLSTESDHYWLSEFLCFVRAHCVELIHASPAYVMHRKKSKKVQTGQVGLRCRFCAHRPPKDRVGRSSSFPSSKIRIYQSMAMILMDHFTQCKDLPPEVKAYFLSLEGRPKGGVLE